MSMRIDHARHQRRVAKIDDGCTVGNQVATTNGDYLVAINNDRGILQRVV